MYHPKQWLKVVLFSMSFVDNIRYLNLGTPVLFWSNNWLITYTYTFTDSLLTLPTELGRRTSSSCTSLTHRRQTKNMRFGVYCFGVLLFISFHELLFSQSLDSFFFFDFLTFPCILLCMYLDNDSLIQRHSFIWSHTSDFIVFYRLRNMSSGK